MKHIVKPIFCFIVPIIGLCLTLMGVFVMVGWFLQNPNIVQINPSFVPMQFNTALCFALSGVGFVFLRQKQNNIRLVISIILFAIPALTLIQYIFGINIGLDELFIQHTITVKTSHPGRMAPNTATCFILTAVVFLINRFQNTKDHPNIMGVISATILVLGMVSLIGYMTNVDTAYVWSKYTSMAVHTSIGFVIIGTILTLYTHCQTESLNFQWISWVLLFSFLLFTISMYRAFEEQEQQQVKTVIDTEAQVIANDINDRIYLLMAAHERLADRWLEDKGTPKNQFFSDAGNYTADHGAFAAYKWVDKDYTIQWLVPESSRQEYLKFDTPYMKQRALTFNKAKKERKTVISDFMKFKNGTFGFHITTPLYYDNRFDGFITAIFSIDKFMSSLLLKHPALRDYEFKLYSNNQLIYDWQNSFKINKTFRLKKTLKVLNSEWSYTLTPSIHAVNKLRSKIPEVILYFGIIVSFIMYLLARLSFINIKRKNNLEKLNQNLEEIIQDRTKSLEKAKNSAINMMLDAEESKKKIESYAHELQEKQDELEETNIELEQFAYVASHDLQEPLRKIISFTTILERTLEGKLEDDSIRHFKFVTDAAYRMRDLIQALLNLSRLGRKEIVKESVDLNEVVQGVESLLSLAIEEKKAKIEYSHLPTVPCSKEFIAQVFQNLIGNAIKFQAEGVTPVVTIKAFQKPEHWLIQVHDNGIGIDKEYLNKVFVIFQRLHRKEDYKGTGIGLAICKKIIDNHGGRIWFESEPGQGSTFCFTLPHE